MQDRIEELEYIKNNMEFSSNPSLFSNETEENPMDFSLVNSQTNYDRMRRESLMFLHEAQRLANERRASLARLPTGDVSTSESTEKISDVSENDEHNTFNFDQRSEEPNDAADLNDFKPTSPS